MIKFLPSALPYSYSMHVITWAQYSALDGAEAHWILSPILYFINSSMHVARQAKPQKRRNDETPNECPRGRQRRPYEARNQCKVINAKYAVLVQRIHVCSKFHYELFSSSACDYFSDPILIFLTGFKKPYPIINVDKLKIGEDEGKEDDQRLSQVKALQVIFVPNHLLRRVR